MVVNAEKEIDRDKTKLGYLGEEYQQQLVKVLIEDFKFFVDVYPILDQNKFTNECLRRIVGFMKDRYAETESQTTYSDLKLMIRSRVNDSITQDIMLEMLKHMYELKYESLDLTKEICGKFFKQQNLVKTLKEIENIVRDGDFSHYDEIVGKIQKALEVNDKKDLGWQLFDNLESDLSDSYRIAIPTGADKLDEALYGGLGKGQLGIIIAPLGTGKAQPLTSLVLTPDGYKTMGSINKGDYVLGYDGHSHKVIEVFPQGVRPVYKLTFSDGSVCECDIDHIWTIRDMYDDKKYKTLTLNELINNGINKRKYALPFLGLSFFNERKTNINPYDFGVITRNKKDSKNFQVPLKYMVNGIVQRIDFLKGLFDSDDITKGKSVDLTLSNKNILKTIEFIAKSLGGHLNKKHNEDKTYTVSIDFNDRDIYLEKAEFSRMDETKCILIDTDDHLYITDDFIITHNTSATTGFAANAAIHQCKENNYKGWKVLHIYFEDTDAEIRRKYYGFATNIDAMNLSLPEMRPIALQRLEENPERKRMLKENIRGKRMESLVTKASDIEAMIKAETAVGFKPDLVIIDYFECLAPEKVPYGTSKSEWEREGITIRKLEALTNKYDIGIWIPIQSNREGIGAEKVGIAQGGGSLKKMQAAHIIVTFAQTEQQKINGTMNLSIEKLRSGKMIRNKFYNVPFNNGTCRFDMSQVDDNYEEVVNQERFKNDQIKAAQLVQ